MDWEEKRQAHTSRTSFTPFYEQQSATSQQPLAGQKRDFPNYLDPHHTRPTHRSSEELPPHGEKQPPTSPARSGGSFDVTWQRSDKEAYYQQLRQELADYQVYRSRQPFKPSAVPSIWHQDAADAFRESQEYGQNYTPAIQAHVEKPAPPPPTAPKQVASETKPKRGLNLNLSEIMAHERPVSGQPFLSHDDYSQTKQQPPYLKKETNGEENKDE